MEFEKYLKELAKHELKEKYGVKNYLDNPRNSLLVTSGIHLNWLGDFFSNKNIKWRKKTFSLDQIILTGMYGELNNILIKICHRNPRKVQELMKKDKKIKKIIMDNASYSEKPIILRNDEENPGKKFKVLDGMNRVLGKIAKNEEKFKAYYPLNEFDHLPTCEPHVVYDLIRGFTRHAKDEKGKEQLYHSLMLLSRTYENVVPLLKERFGPDRVFDKEVQEVISKVLNNE